MPFPKRPSFGGDEFDSQGDDSNHAPHDDSAADRSGNLFPGRRRDRFEEDSDDYPEESEEDSEDCSHDFTDNFTDESDEDCEDCSEAGSENCSHDCSGNCSCDGSGGESGVDFYGVVIPPDVAAGGDSPSVVPSSENSATVSPAVSGIPFDEAPLAVPRWFVRICSLVLTMAIPWGAWMVMQLASVVGKVEAEGRIRSRFEVQTESDLSELRRRIERLEDKLDRALSP